MTLFITGGLRIDYVITAEGEARVRQMGGNGLYSAAGARLWANQVELIARIGENYPAEWLDELGRYGLGTAAVRRVPGWQEMRTFYAYVDAHTRVDRDPALHFARIGHPLPPDLEGYEHSLLSQHNQTTNPLMMRAMDLPAAAAGAAAAHISASGIVAHAELSQGFRRLGVSQVTLDPGEYPGSPENLPLIRAICASVDAFLPSELEVRLLVGEMELREAAQRLASWGPPIVVIKRGARGCLIYERDSGRFTAIPVYPARVVDVTGAGDSFCGGFAAGLLQSGDPTRAALMGIVSASFAVENYGALHVLGQPSARAAARLEELAQTIRSTSAPPA
jgi:sugar/nucleoside kinase (ribokinase family)